MPTPIPAAHIDALLSAVLATYNYPLDRAWGLLDGLRAQGLCDPDSVAGWSEQEVGTRLKAAGYDRGGVTWIVAPRVAALMEAVAGGRFARLGELVAAGDREGVTALVVGVKGMGPKSARLVWELLGPPTR